MKTYFAESKINGKGTFAAKSIKEGEIIKILTGIEYSEPEIDRLIDQGILKEDDDFQIAEDKFLILSPDCYHFNHSCEPNTGIKKSNELVAIGDIAAGEEITLDYSTVSGLPNGYKSSHSNINWIMNCNCQSRICRKKIGYVLSIPKRRLEKYQQMNALPDYILNQLNSVL